jgi:molybdate transport system ATP-binding protein
MLLVSHDPIEVQALCDDLLVLRQGELVAQGPPTEVLTDPKVFPMADREGFETLLPGTLVAHHKGTSRVRLGDPATSSGPELLLLPRAMPVGSKVLVGIAASGVLLAVERPRGLSARNILPAKIIALETLERQTLVTTEIGRGLPRITVQVAETTPQRLDLALDSQIYLIVKAAACRLYGESG